MFNSIIYQCKDIEKVTWYLSPTDSSSRNGGDDNICFPYTVILKIKLDIIYKNLSKVFDTSEYIWNMTTFHLFPGNVPSPWEQHSLPYN